MKKTEDDKVKNVIKIGDNVNIENSNISGGDTNISESKKTKKWLWYILVPLLVAVVSGILVWLITALILGQI